MRDRQGFWREALNVLLLGKMNGKVVPDTDNINLVNISAKLARIVRPTCCGENDEEARFSQFVANSSVIVIGYATPLMLVDKEALDKRTEQFDTIVAGLASDNGFVCNVSEITRRKGPKRVAAS